MNDDATLVALARSGDQAAFSDLYERYFDRVYDFLARMVRDPSEAADLTQDTFLRAMNSLASLTKGASFKSWLFTIARNTALNRLERAARTQPLEGTNDAGEEQRYDVVDEDRFGNPESAAEATRLASLVWEAAASLDPKYRSILMLNVREGLDSAEIADVMGVTRNHAYVLVNRMKAALESAVGALALFRAGRRECAELDAVIAGLQVGELTPDARRAIERHAGSCEKCQEQRRKLASPFAIFAGMGLMAPAPGVRESILAHLQSAFGMLVPEAAAPATGGTGDTASASPAGAQTTGESGGPSGNGAPSRMDGSAPSAHDAGGGHSGNGAAPSLASQGGGALRARRRAAFIGAAAGLLLLFGGPIVALSFFGGEEDAAATVAAAETPVAEATASPGATLTPTPLPTSSPSTETPTSTPTVETTPELTETALATGGAGQALAPDGDGSAATPVPVEPGPPEPGLDAPPTLTPAAGGPPAGSGNNLLPPDPPTSTPTPTSTSTTTPTPTPTVTSTPCAYAMSATPSMLFFDRDTTTATFTLQGEGCGNPLDFTAQPSQKWISVTPSTGSIPEGGAITLVVSIDIGQATAEGGRIRVTSAAGAIDVLVNVDVPEPPARGGEDPDCGVNCPPPPRGNPPGLTN